MKTATVSKPQEYATKQDLRHLEDRMDMRFKEHTTQIVTELTDVIHEVMDRFDDRFARLELRMDQLEKRMDNLEKEVAEIKQDVRRLYDLADKIIKQQEISEQERLAEKIGVKLSI